ncbi:carbohydrate-binding module family 48 protein [Xylariaceae sp. FL0594]|nr:carbohydrate-binding module family 48 protein [Xylariaceae sp. FL0594]
MGNNPSSTSKQATPTPPASSSADSPRVSKKDYKDSKNLVSIHQPQPHHIRSPASLEASGVQAQGSTISNRNSQSRPLSILNPSASPASTHSERTAALARGIPTAEAKYEESSKPVAVPHYYPETGDFAQDSQLDEGLPTGTTSSSVQDMAYPMPRPPRMPLPIEEEIHTPGSPIFSPENTDDTGVDIAPLDDTTGLPSRNSNLSVVTEDDDTEELIVDKTRPTVPTRITWTHGGHKVYVTGTPFQWSRKQRLSPAKGEENVLETTIRVFPGTHHIKFLVDGTMQTSPDLPTTVDFGNNLVNYIEVSGHSDDSASSRSVRELNIESSAPRLVDAQNLPSRQPSTIALEGDEGAKTRSIVPAEKFSGKLPQYLEDFDQPEESFAYRASTAALERLPPPPALPSFLSKPVLNNTSLIKDDNSVLNMPNHTVLNHLATCSIRNNVLALSATTRYKDKYVTTVIYKPSKN